MNETYTGALVELSDAELDMVAAGTGCAKPVVHHDDKDDKKIKFRKDSDDDRHKKDDDDHPARHAYCAKPPVPTRHC